MKVSGFNRIINAYCIHYEKKDLKCNSVFYCDAYDLYKGYPYKFIEIVEDFTVNTNKKMEEI